MTASSDDAAPAATAAPGPGADPLEKVWAVAGLVAAGILAWMAIDLFRGPRAPEGGSSDESQPGN
jgi:hypothetical protein